MKCPKCGAANAYQPLMRGIECENSACSLFVMPPGKMTPAQSCEVFLKGVKQKQAKLPENTTWTNFPAFDGTKPFYSYPKDGDYTESICSDGLTSPCNPCGEQDKMVAFNIPLRVLNKLFLDKTEFQWDSFSRNGHMTFTINAYLTDKDQDAGEIKMLMNKLFHTNNKAPTVNNDDEVPF